MNWLRLPGFEAGEPELVRDEAGRLLEVRVKPIEDATKRGVWKEGDPAPTDPPLGVDPSLWHNAPDDRAWRRLIRKARG